MKYFCYIFILMLANSVRTMSKFCANLSFLYPNKPFLERYNLARDSGFKAVETGFPFGFTKEAVVKAKNASGLEQILINVYTGDVSKGEMGYAAIPGKEQDFEKSIEVTVDYAKALGARKIHVVAGKVDEITRENDEVYERNLRYAVKVMEKENLTALIEPINKYSVPGYYLNSYRRAVEVIEKINSPNLKLMLDVFHLQQIQGDITHSIQNFKKYIGHVQIAQVPHRNEPDIAGEIDYKFVIELLKNEGYDDWIGLEYKPLNDTHEGLKWVKDFGYKL